MEDLDCLGAHVLVLASQQLPQSRQRRLKPQVGEVLADLDGLLDDLRRRFQERSSFCYFLTSLPVTQKKF